MASNLPVRRAGLMPDRYYGKLEKAKAQEYALTRAREDLATAKIDALTATGFVGQASVASLSGSELAFARQHPHAAHRQQLVTDRTVIAIVRVIDRLERDLG